MILKHDDLLLTINFLEKIEKEKNKKIIFLKKLGNKVFKFFFKKSLKIKKNKKPLRKFIKKLKIWKSLKKKHKTRIPKPFFVSQI